MPNTVISYVDKTLWVTVESITVDDGTGPVSLTSSAQFDTFTCEVKKADGTLIGTAVAMELSQNPAHPAGTWRAQINTPDLPLETVHVHPVIRKGAATMPFHGTIRVKPFA